MGNVLGFTQFDRELMIKYSMPASQVLKKDYWMTLESFSYDIGFKGSNRKVIVPKGFLTDGASVPRPFWSMIPPWGQYGQAVAIHDLLCETLTIFVDGKPVAITRKEADHILKEALGVLGVESLKLNTIYGGVSAYRKLFNVSKPSIQKGKNEIEAILRAEMEKGHSVV